MFSLKQVAAEEQAWREEEARLAAKDEETEAAPLEPLPQLQRGESIWTLDEETMRR